MIRIRRIIAVLGFVIRAFGVIVILPALMAAFYQEWTTLLQLSITAGFSVLAGQLALRQSQDLKIDQLSRLEGMAVVAFGWLMVAVFGGIPFFLSGFSIIDSLFESMSGFTTTGATIIRDFSQPSASLFFYRGFIQWLGGVGILVLFVAILPHLAVAGRQLFFAETSAASKEKLTPRIRDTARRIWGWYAFLTIIQIMMLMWSGLSFNDSAANSFTTMAAGGFSPHGESIMGYCNPAAEWIIIVFMLLAGANFTLQVKTALRGNLANLLRNHELRSYLIIVFITSVLLSGIFMFESGPDHTRDPGEAFRSSAFQSLSILTTTGFATEDFENWSQRAKTILIVLMFIGGCSGSAGGGIKVIRFMFLLSAIKVGIRKAIHPEAVLMVRVGKRVFRKAEVQPILTFILLYFMIFSVAGILVSILENDLVIGLSGSIATLGNIGPGFGQIGPMGNYADLTAVTKLIFFFLMWAGRLELMTLLVFCKPEIWRNSSW